MENSCNSRLIEYVVTTILCQDLDIQFYRVHVVLTFVVLFPSAVVCMIF